MTDKQIIIDGVNVAGCIRLQDDEISCDLGGECKGWENCYYKQLKRKEQECNKLKQTLTEIKEICRFNFTMTITNLLAKTILQKISECEVENEYNTKDIRHINENNQEYIAECNRMIKNN